MKKGLIAVGGGVGGIPQAMMRASGLLDVRASAGGTLDAAALQEFTAAVNDFKAHMDGRMKAVEANITLLEDESNKQALQAAGRMLNGPSDSDGLPADPAYRATFASYARRGAGDAEASLKAANTGASERGAIMAAMSEGDNSAGGYLAPVEWDRQIRKSQRALSPMRRISQVVTTGVNGYSTLWNSDQWGSGWVGETASRPNTSNPTLTPLVFPTGEIYANPTATQRLIDDAAVDFEGWISTELSMEFDRQEGIAMVSGNGLNKPMGFLQYLPGGAAAAAVLDGSGNVVTPAQPLAHPGGNLATVPTGDAAKITADSLVDLKYKLGTPYRQGAVWLMNSQTAAVIAKLKDGQGSFLWREAFAVDQPATLLGSPVEIDENMPDIAAGNTPVAFGNFQRGYLINDRIGVRILRDPYTNKPYVCFYATKRVGGGVLDPRAIVVLKVAAS